MVAQRGLDPDEHEVVDERRSIRAPVVYEIIRQEGVEELERPLVSLWWRRLFHASDCEPPIVASLACRFSRLLARTAVVAFARAGFLVMRRPHVPFRLAE
jgi:hypothetical protein